LKSENRKRKQSRERKHWKVKEECYLIKTIRKEGRSNETYDKIAANLNRSKTSVMQRVSKVKTTGAMIFTKRKVKRQSSSRIRWSKVEDKLLWQHRKLSYVEIQNYLPDRSIRGIEQRLARLKKQR